MSPKRKGTATSAQQEPGKPVVRLHIWLQSNNGAAFGLGRLMLLEAIEETGSLKAAAQHLGMSYRAAWGKVKTSEEALGQALVEKTGGNRSGYTLTPYGRAMMEKFRQWFQNVEKAAQEQARELFPFEVSGFEESREQQKET